MLNNFFDTKETPLNRFWEWFQPGEKQKEEIQVSIRSIIQVKLIKKLIELTRDKEKLIEKIKSLNQNDEKTSSLIVVLFADLEQNYYELIDEIIGQLNQEELTNLAQFLEEK